MLNKAIHIFFIYSALFLFFISNVALGKLDLNRLVFEPTILNEAIELQPNNLDTGNSDNIQNSLTSQTLNRALDIDQYQSALTNIELSEGPLAENLAEQLGSLGKLQLQNGDYAAAIETFQQGRHIIRVNHGLYTLQQIEFLEGLIDAYSGQGETENIDGIQEHLYYIHKKNYSANEPAMAAAAINWANWNVQAFQKLHAPSNTSPPLFNVGSKTLNSRNFILYHDPALDIFTYVPRGGMSGETNYTVNMSILVEPRLLLARNIYQSALEHNQLGPEADELRKNIANIDYIIKTRIHALKNSVSQDLFSSRRLQSRRVPKIVTSGYKQNLVGFENKVLQEKSATNVNFLTLAQALLELADWHLLYEHPQEALPIYHEAFMTLQDSGISESEIGAIMSPQPFLSLPVFFVQPYSRQAHGISTDFQLNPAGYIDIQLTHNQEGSNTNIKVLQSSKGTDRQIRDILIDHLKDQKHRPFFINGQPVEQADLKYRFFYSY